MTGMRQPFHSRDRQSLAGQRPLRPTGAAPPQYFGLLRHFQDVSDLDARR
jgi:hypothetical protein